MTICIAAIGKCEDLGIDGEAIVFATDHMITLSQIGEFEHSIEKYRTINSNTVVMLSGEALLFDELLDGVPSNGTVDEIKEKIYSNMVNIRAKRIEKIVLDRFKVDFDYVKELLKLPDHNDTVSEFLGFIKEYDLETSVMLAGFKDGKAQIYEINEVDAINTRDINFNAIGSGGTQAINTLLFQKHSKANNLKVTLYNVYKAKRNSEVSGGVGKETDIYILLSNGKKYEITSEINKSLSEIYQQEMKFGKENKELDNIIKNLGVI